MFVDKQDREQPLPRKSQEPNCLWMTDLLVRSVYFTNVNVCLSSLSFHRWFVLVYPICILPIVTGSNLTVVLALVTFISWYHVWTLKIFLRPKHEYKSYFRLWSRFVLKFLNFYELMGLLCDCQFKILTIILSSKFSLEMESLKMSKESLISMEIGTFDRLRSALNSFYWEESLSVLDHHTKGDEHMCNFLWLCAFKYYYWFTK